MRNHYNGLKTAALIGLLWMVLLIVGALIAGGTGNRFWILVFGAIALVQTVVGYWNSDKIALRSMQARPITQAEAPELYQIVESLSQQAGQPMPALYIAPTKTPNAFATGRDPEHAAVCVTEGIMDLLELRELRAVLGHELSHVYNRDILTSSVAAGIAGVITSIAQFAFFFGGRDREDGGTGILLALVAPFAATLIQFSISRTREFDADEDGARLANDPLALASALKKLETGIARRPLASSPERQTVASMMIANPFNVRNLFSTHPPMDERIRRLEKMAGY
ncbi:M48 family metalloprotease [Mobiluncus porci]|uniref:Protease HtpX homolog n=1 Tax=Mobiluncus porci TaxID=2652278 RepID=A0A7K0K0M2_9ACTO|nr:M48 family metalloprotease [Mobiluncus porci]